MPNTELTKQIGEKVRFYREKSKLSQKSLAAEAGMATNTVARLEGGKHPPSIKTLEKLAKVLKVDVSDILKD